MVIDNIHIPLKSKDPRQNHLLSVLPEVERARIFPHLELVSLELGEVLYESGCHLGYVYFPATAIVSLLSLMENSSSAEIAIVGYDGADRCLQSTSNSAAGCSALTVCLRTSLACPGTHSKHAGGRTPLRYYRG